MALNIKNNDNHDTPSLGYTKLYSKENKKYYFMDDTGAEFIVGGGVSDFTDLLDTPSAYTDQAGKYLKVNSGEDAVEFAEVTVVSSEVGMDVIGTPTYTTVKDWSDVTQSAGIISGGAITDAGSGNINVSEVQGVIKITNSNVGENKFFTLAAVSDQAVTDSSINYIAVDYNSGTPQLLVSTSNSANGRTIFNLGKVFREGTTIDIINSGVQLQEVMKRIQQHHIEEASLHFVSGAIVSETGTRNIYVTAGVMYAGLNRITVPIFDSSATDTFEYYYYTGAAWTESDATQINNTQYNNIATGLATLSNNQYGVHWVYKGTNGNCYVIYGQSSYTLSGAQAAQPPSSIPSHVEEMGVLRAKIIIEKSDTTFTEIESVTDVQFTASSPSNHNDLGGLQGGTADQYYHLTSTEHPYISGANAQSLLTTASPTFAGGTFTGFPTTPSSAPTTDYQVANKKYVDDNGGSDAGGSDTYIQFNDGGTDFGGDSGFTFDKTNNTVTLTGSTNDGSTDTIVIKDSDDAMAMQIDSRGYIKFADLPYYSTTKQISSSDGESGINFNGSATSIISGATIRIRLEGGGIYLIGEINCRYNGSATRPTLRIGYSNSNGFYPSNTDGTDTGLNITANSTQVTEFRATVVDFKVPTKFVSLTTTEKNALTPEAGWVVWDETLTKLQVYTGSAWESMH